MQDIITYITIMLSSGVKFIFGPTLGMAANVSWVLTSMLTATGMMLSVVVFVFFGEKLKVVYHRYFKKEKQRIFTPKARRLVRIWNKFGIVGIALLTPILLTPIGGTLLAVAFGVSRVEIIKYMAISAIFWAFVITFSLKFASGLLFPSLFGALLVF